MGVVRTMLLAAAGVTACILLVACETAHMRRRLPGDKVVDGFPAWREMDGLKDGVKYYYKYNSDKGPKQSPILPGTITRTHPATLARIECEKKLSETKLGYILYYTLYDTLTHEKPITVKGCDIVEKYKNREVSSHTIETTPPSGYITSGKWLVSIDRQWDRYMITQWDNEKAETLIRYLDAKIMETNTDHKSAIPLSPKRVKTRKSAVFGKLPPKV